MHASYEPYVRTGYTRGTTNNISSVGLRMRETPPPSLAEVRRCASLLPIDNNCHAPVRGRPAE
jgi:hypothetical protein